MYYLFFQHTVQLLKNSLYSLENLTNISVNALRRDLELIKQCLLQQNFEINMFINDLKTKYDTLTYHLQQVFQVSSIFICILFIYYFLMLLV